MSSLRKTANRQTQPKQKKTSCTIGLWLHTNDPPESPLCLGEWSASQQACKCIRIFRTSYEHYYDFNFIFIFPPLEVCFCASFCLFRSLSWSTQIQRFVNAEPRCCWLCRVGIIPGRRHCPVVLTVSPFAVATAKAVTCGGMQRCFLRFLGLRHWFPCWTFAMMQQGLVLVL